MASQWGQNSPFCPWLMFGKPSQYNFLFVDSAFWGFFAPRGPTPLPVRFRSLLFRSEPLQVLLNCLFLTYIELACLPLHIRITYSKCYIVRIKKKVIHIQRPIVLKSIHFNIWMWPVCKEQLILFPLVPFLHHVCHAFMTEYIAI